MAENIQTEDSKRAGRPFRHIPVRSFDPETNIFFLQTESGESRLGICLQGSPLTGADDGTVDRLKSVLSTTVPAGSFAQIGLFSEPEISAATGAYISGKMEAKGVLARLAHGRKEFIEEGVNTSLPGMQGVLLHRQRVIFSLSIPCDAMPSKKQLDLMKSLSDKFAEGLSSVGLWLTPMDEAQYLALIRRFFHLYDEDDFVTDEYAPLREQVFGPADTVEFGTEDVTFNDGEYYSKTLSVKHFPPYSSIGLMNMLIGDPKGSKNQITDPYWMTATIHYPDQDKTISKVRQKFAWITNQQFGGLSHMIPSLRYKKEGIDTLVHEMDGAGGSLCEFNLSMTIFSRSKERLDGQTSAFRAWAATWQLDMREDKRILKPLFYLFLPLGASQKGIKNLFRFHTMAISHAVRHLPIIADWLGTGSGATSIFNTRRGSCMFFDPYDSDGNHNGIIIAGSGSGKSFLAQQLQCDMMAGGGRVWVIDQGRSYEKLCRSLGGQFIEFSEESNICLNPFTKILDIDEEMDILKAMFAKMAAPEDGLDDYRMAALEEKIKSAYSKSARKANADLVAQLCLDDEDQRIKDIGKQLYPFTRHGTYGRWFNGENNVDMSNDYVVLELKELENKKTLQQVVLIQLFSSISYEMYHTHGRKKGLFIDEAWSLLDDHVMGKAIEIAYRTVRKHQGSAWLITQNIGDVYNSPNGNAIVSSAEYQIIMSQREDSIDEAVRSGRLKMDIYEMQMLKSIHTVQGKYAELMVRNSTGWGIGRLIVDRFTQILFSSKGWERELVFERMDAGEDVEEIIDKLVQEGR